MGLHDPLRANSDLPRILAKDTKHTRTLKRQERGRRKRKQERDAGKGVARVERFHQGWGS